MTFQIQFQKPEQIGLDLKNRAQFDLRFQHFQRIIRRDDVDYYDGDYVVTPAVTAQTLSTREKYLEQDVTIKEIPYFEVGNTVGGATVFIGKELD